MRPSTQAFQVSSSSSGSLAIVARHHAPAVVAAPPFGQRDRLLEHRHLQGQRAVGIEHEGSAIEHQLVLPADLVEIGHRQPRLGDPRHHQVQAHVILVALERRAIGHQQDFGPGLGQRLAGFFGPDILADRHAEAHALEGDGAGSRARLEHPLLVEHAVVRQVELVAQRFDLAIGQQRHGIVQVVAVAPRQAHQHGRAGDRVLCQFLDRRLAGRNKTWPQHQILGRIAADEQFRKQDQIGIRRLGPRLARLGEIGIDGAQRGVELGQRDDESVGHDVGVLADAGQAFNCAPLTGPIQLRMDGGMILKTLLDAQSPEATAITAPGRAAMAYGLFASVCDETLSALRSRGLCPQRQAGHRAAQRSGHGRGLRRRSRRRDRGPPEPRLSRG